MNPLSSSSLQGTAGIPNKFYIATVLFPMGCSLAFWFAMGNGLACLHPLAQRLPHPPRPQSERCKSQAWYLGHVSKSLTKGQ